MRYLFASFGTSAAVCAARLYALGWPHAVPEGAIICVVAGMTSALVLHVLAGLMRFEGVGEPSSSGGVWA